MTRQGVHVTMLHSPPINPWSALDGAERTVQPDVAATEMDSRDAWCSLTHAGSGPRFLSACLCLLARRSRIPTGTFQCFLMKQKYWEECVLLHSFMDVHLLYMKKEDSDVRFHWKFFKLLQLLRSLSLYKIHEKWQLMLCDLIPAGKRFLIMCFDQ